MFWIRLMLSGCLGVTLMSCSTMASGSNCRSEKVILGETDFQVNTALYRATQPSSKTLLLMPPTGGENYLDRSYAEKFCRAGYDVYILENWTGDSGSSTDLEIHQGFYSKMLKAVDLVLTKVETPFVGMLGTSLGGLYTAVAVAKRPRFDAAFAIVAGAPIAEIIATSDQKAMVNLKEDRRKRFHLETEQSQMDAIGKVFSLEPMKQGEIRKGMDLGMVIATDDTTVPSINQSQLQSFWKPTKVISLDNGHFWAIINTWRKHDGEILEFFNSSAARKQSSKN